MKRVLYLWLFVMLISIVSIEPIYSQTPLLDSAKIAVVNYYNKRYSKTPNSYSPNDLNKRFAIIDILTSEPVRAEIKNGKLYHCKLFGDDVFGVYMLMDNDKIKLMEIENVLQIARARLFMSRHNYSSQQISSCLDYITLVFIKEQMSLSYVDFIEDNDYLEYLKESQTDYEN